MNKEIEEILRKKEEEQKDNNSQIEKLKENKICANCQHFFKGQCRKSLDPIDYKDVSPLWSCGSFHLDFDEKDFDEVKIKARNETKKEIYTALLINDKNKATEEIVNLFKSENWVFSLRDDEKEEVWIYNNGIYEPNGISYIKEFVRNIVGKAYTTHFANIIIEKIKTDTFIEKDVFFNSANSLKDKIPVWNGVLNLKTRELEGFEPIKIFFSKIPVDYKPGYKCEKIIKFFNDILERQEDIDVLQEWFGYCLYKDYQIEKSIMLFGKGRNGKGQLLELLKRFVGFDNVSSVSLNRLVDENSFNVAELHNKLVNIGGDVDGSYLEKVGMFQQLTGNDLISAKRKFKTDIKFTNYSKLIFACNNLPRPGQTSEGFWDRWILFKFPFKFVHKEIYDEIEEEERENLKIRTNNIISELTNENEMSGLLNWALDGLDRLMKKGHFTLTKSTREVKDQWIKASNSLIPFCEEFIEQDYDGMITKEHFRHIYNSYCSENKIETVSDKSIHYYLTKELGVVSHKEYVNMEEWQEDFSGGKTKYKQIMCWKGISYSKGSKDSNGFSTYRKKGKFTIGEKRVDIHTTLTTIDDNPNSANIQNSILNIFSTKKELSLNDIYEKISINPEELEEELKDLKTQGLIVETKPNKFIKL